MAEQDSTNTPQPTTDPIEAIRGWHRGGFGAPRHKTDYQSITTLLAEIDRLRESERETYIDVQGIKADWYKLKETIDEMMAENRRLRGEVESLKDKNYQEYWKGYEDGRYEAAGA